MLILTILLVVTSLLVFIVYPLFQIARTSLVDVQGDFSIRGYQRILRGGNLFTSLSNSLKLALIVSTLSTIIAYIFAYTINYVKVPFKKVFQWHSNITSYISSFCVSTLSNIVIWT